MTIQHIFIKSEKCRITADGPVVTREYRIGDDSDTSDGLAFLMGPYSSWRNGDDRLPTLGMQFSQNGEIFVSDVQAQRTGEDEEFQIGSNSVMLHIWKVTVEWRPIGGPENRWNNTPYFDIQVFGETLNIDSLCDWEGNRNTNTAGEYFEDRLPIQVPVVVVRMTERNPSNPPIFNLFGKTNAEPWWNRGTGCWLCRDVQGQWVQEDPKVGGLHSDWETSGYWKNTYEFVYNPQTWNLKKANVGYYHLETTGTRVRNMNVDGSEKIRPSLLNLDGTLRNEELEPVLLPFAVYDSIEFPTYFPCPLTNLNF